MTNLRDEPLIEITAIYSLPGMFHVEHTRCGFPNIRGGGLAECRDRG